MMQKLRIWFMKRVEKSADALLAAIGPERRATLMYEFLPPPLATGRQGRQPVRASARTLPTRSRWSLDIVKKSTLFRISKNLSQNHHGCPPRPENRSTSKGPGIGSKTEAPNGQGPLAAYESIDSNP